ncbi:PDC sensor domain-containing protein [Caldovatus aquaticus]|uniref:Uncharacterized protein n=1 Tax=Caldovatus aquaticus TaxID=2865671 RepID=A0ABS7F128_9PROT|nr:hypothetical protein [Caldovatus aquaticus]MBW8269264.1 hypothetical protein [Caldovatus aquaticus]
MLPSARLEPRRAGRQRLLAAWVSALTAWAVSVLLLHGDYAASLRREEQRLEFAALERAAAMAEAAGQALQHVLDVAAGLHALLQAREHRLRAGDAAGAAAIEDHLAALARRGDFAVQAIAAIGPDGTPRRSATAQARRDAPVAPPDRGPVALPRDGRRGLHVGAPEPADTGALRWRLPLARPLEDPAGHFAGLALVAFDPLELSARLGALHAGEGESSLVLRVEDGALLALGAAEERRFLGGRLPEEAALLRLLHAERAGKARIWNPFTGRELLLAYRLVPDTPLAVAYGLDAERELAPVRALRRSAQAAMAVTAVVSLAALLLVL